MMMGGGGMGIIMILFWVVVLIAVGLLVSGLMTRRSSSGDTVLKVPGEANALEILKRRYASGEISKIEYENMRRDLQ
jgi:putative membrane protein